MSARAVLVTGASGFAGREVVRQLAAGGRRVRAAVRRREDEASLARIPGVEPVRMDLENAMSLRDVVRGVKEIHHFAALVSARAPAGRLVATNAEGTRRLCRAAAASGVGRFLYCSTTAVYGLHSRRSMPVTEAVPARAFEPYGRSKLLGEAAVREMAEETGAAVVVLRPAAILGPGDRNEYADRLRRAAVSRVLLLGAFSRGRFSWIHVADVAAAAIHLLKTAKGPPEVVNAVVEPPVLFSDAFLAWLHVLARRRPPPWRAILCARLSLVVQGMVAPAANAVRTPFCFTVGGPGFDIVYSGRRLAERGYRIRRRDFARALADSFPFEAPRR